MKNLRCKRIWRVSGNVHRQGLIGQRWHSHSPLGVEVKKKGNAMMESYLHNYRSKIAHRHIQNKIK